jgi:hypothetical protein
MFSSIKFATLLPRAAALVLLCAVVLGGARMAAAQQQTPLTNEEFLALVRQLPKSPNAKQELIDEIRRRGIGFMLTGGLRSFVATKSGNDEELRRVLEEAERRFRDPAHAPALPPATEAEELMRKTREETLNAVDQMPDFVVRQLITRAVALGTSQNWRTSDRLIVAVSYRASEGERYRLLSVNGTTNSSADERGDYREAGGANSTGEFVSMLKSIFKDEAAAHFKPLDTDTLRGRRAIVYEYDIKLKDSSYVLSHGDAEGDSVVVAHRGKVWVDREKARVLRIESEAYDVPRDFPMRASNVALDYDWVTIAGQGDYLLPARSVVVMTVDERGRTAQFRNDIRFRNYQKFGTELKIIEDDDFVEEPVPETPNQEAPPKPSTPKPSTPKPPEKRP